MIANPSSDIIYYKARTVVAHLEPIKQIASVNEVLQDDLCHQLYQNLQDLDGVSLQIPESRIAIDAPKSTKGNTSLPLELMNCHNTDLRISI